MGVSDTRYERVSRIERVLYRLVARLGLWAVGDRTGGALFLGCLLVYAFGWQAGITILDTYAVANGFVAVANGHLHVETVAFGPGFDTPGMHYVDGRYYARNYGYIVPALPVFWLLEGIAVVAELRVAIAALWSLCLVWFASIIATLRGDNRIRAAGALVALAVFLLNLRAPTPVPEGTTVLLALQLVAMVAAAFSVVLVYRLLSRVRSYRTGLLGGALVAVGTPVAFWASIPKRHTLTVAVLFGVAYLLFRSRTAERATPWNPTTLRAGTYVLVGLFAWVHAPLAVTLFLPLVVIDAASAPSNAPRDVAVLAGAFFLSLVPFFLTNVLISGNPVQPPRLLTPADVVDVGSVAGDPAPGGTTEGGSGGTGGDGSVPLLGALQTAVGAVGPMVGRVLGVYWNGLVVVAEDPGRLYRVVVASTGHVDHTAPGSVERASNLSMVESMPLLGAALALPLGVFLSLVGRDVSTPMPATSESDAVSSDDGAPSRRHVASLRVRELGRHFSGAFTPTDAFLFVTSVLILLVYLPRLPTWGQITMRYLTPLYPVAVYAVCTDRRLGDELVERIWTVAYAYEATVLLGVPAMLGLILWFGLGETTAFETLAGAGVVVGAALALVILTFQLTGSGGRALAGSVGVAAGTTTGFVLLSQLVLFHYGIHLLPVVQSLTEAIRLILVRTAV